MLFSGCPAAKSRRRSSSDNDVGVSQLIKELNDFIDETQTTLDGALADFRSTETWKSVPRPDKLMPLRVLLVRLIPLVRGNLMLPTKKLETVNWV